MRSTCRRQADGLADVNGVNGLDGAFEREPVPSRRAHLHYNAAALEPGEHASPEPGPPACRSSAIDRRRTAVDIAARQLPYSVPWIDWRGARRPKPRDFRHAGGAVVTPPQGPKRANPAKVGDAKSPV